MALSLHTPAIVFDQSCDCGKLHYGTVKTHVILAALLGAGLLLMVGAFLLSLRGGEEELPPAESPAAAVQMWTETEQGRLYYEKGKQIF